MALKEKLEKIKEYWDQQAKVHSEAIAATTHDPLQKELEYGVLRRKLRPEFNTLELGCGNGSNLFGIEPFMSRVLKGVDYSEHMIKAAREVSTNKGLTNKITFEVGNILEDLSKHGMYEQIFTVRCLINLPSTDLQLQAVKNMSSILVPGGTLLLIECAQSPLDRTNEYRELAGLDTIPYHWHNLYLDESTFLEHIPEELEHVETESFSSLYYLISRVFNAKLTPEGQSPDYFSPMNILSTKLPPIGDFGPQKLYIFKKRV